MRSVTVGDVAVISDPSRWNRWPILPLKRPEAMGFQTGFMVDKEPIRWTVALVSIYRVREYNFADDWVKFFANLPNELLIKYPTLDDLINDGWMLD